MPPIRVVLPAFHPLSFWLRCLVVLIVVAETIRSGSAQAPTMAYTRHELDLGILNDPTVPTLRYTLNLSPALAVETLVGGVPKPTFFGQDNVFATLGMKLGIRRGHWGFYGTIDPGWAIRPDQKIRESSTFKNGINYIYLSSDRSIERSRFILDTGIAFEYSITQRTFFRADLQERLEPTFLEQIYTSPFIGITSPGYISQYPTLSLSAGHRFGKFRDEPTHIGKPPHVDFGAIFSLYGRTHLLEGDTLFNPGYGAWASASLSKYVSLDASAFHAPHDDKTGDFQDGGNETLVLGGIKTGIRRDRVGLFFKARTGAARFSRTYGGSSFATLNDYVNDPGHPTWQPVLDVGSVVEVYPARHLILRAELGPAVVFYRPTTFSIQGQNGTIAGTSAASALLLFGGGFRF
jgi:hypothetical protein